MIDHHKMHEESLLKKLAQLDLINEVTWQKKYISLFILIAIFILGITFIPIPEIVKSDIIIVSENYPLFVYPPRLAEIKTIFVNDQQYINKNQAICTINTDVDYRKILELKTILQHYISAPLDLPLIQVSIVGEPYIDSVILSLKKTISNIDPQSIDPTNGSRKSGLIENYKEQFELLKRKLLLLQKGLDSSERQYAAYSNLYAKEFISENNLILHENNVNIIKQNVISTELEIKRLEGIITEKELLVHDEFNNNILECLQIMNDVLTKINNWEVDYVIKSSIAGIVEISDVFEENQMISPNQRICTVIPEQTAQFYGVMNISAEDYAIINEGQTVNIKLDSYPYLKYGGVRGVTKSKSEIRDKSGYSIKIALSSPLVSNIGKEIKAHPILNGKGEILIYNDSFISKVKRRIWITMN